MFICVIYYWKGNLLQNNLHIYFYCHKKVNTFTEIHIFTLIISKINKKANKKRKEKKNFSQKRKKKKKHVQYKLVFFIILRNSCSLISPSPSRSASSIISCSTNQPDIVMNNWDTIPEGITNACNAVYRWGLLFWKKILSNRNCGFGGVRLWESDC